MSRKGKPVIEANPGGASWNVLEMPALGYSKKFISTQGCEDDL